MSSAQAVLNFITSEQPYVERHRVCRLEALFNPALGVRFGHVNRVYAGRDSNDLLNPHRERYEVLWDNGEKEADLVRQALYLVPLEESEILAQAARAAAIEAEVAKFQTIIWE